MKRVIVFAALLSVGGFVSVYGKSKLDTAVGGIKKLDKVDFKSIKEDLDKAKKETGLKRATTAQPAVAKLGKATAAMSEMLSPLDTMKLGWAGSKGKKLDKIFHGLYTKMKELDNNVEALNAILEPLNKLVK